MKIITTISIHVAKAAVFLSRNILSINLCNGKNTYASKSPPTIERNSGLIMKKAETNTSKINAIAANLRIS